MCARERAEERAVERARSVAGRAGFCCGAGGAWPLLVSDGAYAPARSPRRGVPPSGSGLRARTGVLSQTRGLAGKSVTAWR